MLFSPITGPSIKMLSYQKYIDSMGMSIYSYTFDFNIFKNDTFKVSFSDILRNDLDHFDTFWRKFWFWHFQEWHCQKWHFWKCMSRQTSSIRCILFFWVTRRIVSHQNSMTFGGKFLGKTLGKTNSIHLWPKWFFISDKMVVYFM